MADNYLKSGRILNETARESSARRKWNSALPYIQRSLHFELTEWGLAVEKELNSLLGTSTK